MNNEFCVDCGIEMKKTYVTFNDVKVEAQRCGNCGKKNVSGTLGTKSFEKIGINKT